MSTASRPTLTERRAAELRMTIALTARDIFLADGSTSATVERICEAVGIAPRTFHRHFPVKEDVVMPLFRRFGGLSVEVLETAPRTSDTVETLVTAFSTEVAKRGAPEIDRRFMSLMITDPQYRLRWLDWGQDFADPISEFLAERVDLGADPFVRTLPAQLVIQICRQAYVHWVEHGNVDRLESSLRAGMRMVVNALPPLPSKRVPAVKSEPNRAARRSRGTRGRE
ncbi:AcrR family transcriptional regulator [Mycobacterium sp. OAS707]|uniref:acyl-CoA-like ligand-binding transcription factor n=1 Tax=Mycobacterium sp. OAS707 TaxID=2663822 RepID=UPI0019EF2A55|nr:AcrR family transcriptional regulator [Mycobacterium sp. OAS707]